MAQPPAPPRSTQYQPQDAEGEMAQQERNTLMDTIKKSQQKLTSQRVQQVQRTGPVSAPQPSLPPPAPRIPRAAGNAGGFGTPAPTAPIRDASYLGVKDNRKHFISTWSQTIEAFVKDTTRHTLEFPNELSSADRFELHRLASEYNLGHHSVGTGRARRLKLSKDELFYKAPNQQPTEDRLNTYMVDQIRGGSGAPKEAKYADGEDAASRQRRLEQFSASTNPHANAVATHSAFFETGGDGRAEKVAVPQSGVWKDVLEHNQSTVAPLMDLAPKGGFKEQCTVCGDASELDYDVAKWDSHGYCGKCKKETVWKLVSAADAKAAAPRPSAPPEAIDVERNKRGRDDGGEDEPTGKSHRSEGLTADSAADTAEVLGMAPMTVEWVRQFASRFGKSVDEHLLFADDIKAALGSDSPTAAYARVGPASTEDDVCATLESMNLPEKNGVVVAFPAHAPALRVWCRYEQAGDLTAPACVVVTRTLSDIV